MSDEGKAKNAIITSASIVIDDHGLLTSWLMLDYGGTSQGFGGYALYLPKTYAHYTMKTCAGHWFWRIMEIAGVSDWSKLPGKTVRVLGDISSIRAIGHIVKNDWFNPHDDFAEDK